MLIDLFARHWNGPDPFAARTAAQTPHQPEDPRRHFADVAAVVYAGYRSDRLGLNVPFAVLASLTASDPGRFFAVAGIDPLAPSLERDLDQALALGFIGVSLAPADQGCRPTHDRFVRTLEWCAAQGMLVHISNPGLIRPNSVMEYARPALLDEALAGIRGLRLVLGDLGAAWTDEALLLCAKHERVFAEIGGVIGRPAALSRLLCDAHERGLDHKLLFSSGSPARTATEAVENVYALAGFGTGPAAKPPVPRDVLRALIERDSLATLGVERRARDRGLIAQPILGSTEGERCD